MKISLKAAADYLANAKNIVITAHVNPDGDAIGSSLALFHFLSGQSKEVRVIIDDEAPQMFAFLPGYGEIQRPAQDAAPIKADLLVILDASLDRVGRLVKLVNAPILNIDHHISNDRRADMLYLDADRAATAEIICQLLAAAKAYISPNMAKCLYTGLATDTGFFRYANTSPLTMRAAADMIAIGARPNEISEALEERSFAFVKGMAQAMRTLEIFAAGKAAGIFLDEELTNSLETTEGLIDNVRIIAGVDVAVLIKCKEPNVCRVSLRSKKVDVSRLAMAFGGGGHIRAAGATLNMPLPEAKQTIITAVEKAVAETYGAEPNEETNGIAAPTDENTLLNEEDISPAAGADNGMDVTEPAEVGAILDERPEP